MINFCALQKERNSPLLVIDVDSLCVGLLALETSVSFRVALKQVSQISGNVLITLHNSFWKKRVFLLRT